MSNEDIKKLIDEVVVAIPPSAPFKPWRKHYTLDFWYPIFPCSYRVFRSQWWSHWFTPRNYINFF